jgi:hypothetical protein
MRRISAALALDSSPITSGTTLPWTRTRHCSMEAGNSDRLTKQRTVQRFHIDVWRSRYSRGTACRYIRSLRYLRYSPQIGRSFSDSVDSVVNLAGIPLKHAAWRHIERLFSPRSAIFDLSQTEVSAEGSRFYFHVDNGSRYPDETGSVFSTADEAMAHAIVVAQELVQDGSWHGSSILVTDDRGHEIVRVRIGR